MTYLFVFGKIWKRLENAFRKIKEATGVSAPVWHLEHTFFEHAALLKQRVPVLQPLRRPRQLNGVQEKQVRSQPQHGVVVRRRAAFSRFDQRKALRALWGKMQCRM